MGSGNLSWGPKSLSSLASSPLVLVRGELVIRNLKLGGLGD